LTFYTEREDIKQEKRSKTQARVIQIPPSEPNKKPGNGALKNKSVKRWLLCGVAQRKTNPKCI